MNILTKYIIRKYLLHLFIIFISLQIFFTGMDFLQNFKDLPKSANLQLLYLMYNSFFILTLILPLSLVFAWVLTLVIFVRNNELVAFSSIGAKRARIYSPIIIISFFVLVVLTLIQLTPLAYSYEEKSKILSGNYLTSSKSDIFLKYNNTYVYIKKLFPFEKKVEDIHVYKVKNNDIFETIIAKKGYFQNNKWYIVDAKIIKKPKKLDFKTSKLEVRYEKFLNILEGFKPKILDSIYEEKAGFSIIDAISAFFLLNKQGVNTKRIRAVIYYEVIVQFFILPLMMLIFIFTSYNRRFFNTGVFVSFSVFGTLVIWGIFFMLHKFSVSGATTPEFSLILPIGILFIVSYIVYRSKTRYG